MVTRTSTGRRLLRLEKRARPSSYCPHLPPVVEDEGEEFHTEMEHEDRGRRNALTCPCGLPRQRIVICYVEEWPGVKEGEETKDTDVLYLRWLE